MIDKITTEGKEQVMEGFKGFKSDWTCQGFRFAPGETVEHEGPVELCNSGFHFCEYPLDVFTYYPPTGSKFAVVEAGTVSDEKGDDSKRVARSMTVKAELDIAGIVRAAVDYTFSRAKKPTKTGVASGDQGAAQASGDRGAAQASGYQGAAQASGDRGAAQASGDQGAAQASGYRGAAQASGYRGAAQASGYRGAAQASGDQGAAQASGYQGAAQASGYRGAAQASGDRGAAQTSGYQGAAQASGYRGAAQASGDRGAAQASGYQGAAQASGDQSIAHADGPDSKACGALDTWLTLSEWSDGWTKRIGVKAVRVDGKRVKADVWYMLKGGMVVKA